MPYDPEKHHRRSIRLRGYDYAQAGAYFITICTQARVCLFGQVVDETMHMNDAGQMVQRWWHELNRKFPTVQTDAFVVMPNHIHGIIIIHPVGADLRVCPNDIHIRPDNIHVCPNDIHMRPDDQRGTHTNQRGTHAGVPLPEIVQWFKTMTTNEYIRHVKNDGWPPFRKRLWQRNYYEHIIRDEKSLHRIRQYIAENPSRWEQDNENPNPKT